MADELSSGVDEIRAAVRERYASAATGRSSCCGPQVTTTDRGGEEVFGQALYDATAEGELPEEALQASLGCGVPIAVAELRAGETVLDLGSGAGADVLISARRVGPTGRAIGLDMINEAARVLRPGGRFAVSDVIADAGMDERTRADMRQWTGCIASALTHDEFTLLLNQTGFEDIEIRETHRVHEHAAAAIFHARKPGRRECCTPAELQACCQPAEKMECCGAVRSAGPGRSSCGCR